MLTQETLFDELKGIATAKDNALVSVHGTCELVRPMEIVYHDQAGSLLKITLPCEDIAQVEQLIQACDPATFGKGREDVLDPSYRTAFKLDNYKFFTNFDLSEHTIAHQIKNALGPPNTKCEMKASLYKLNVYGKGGFFKEHVDTPRSNKMFGSLVVCLDQPFQGGALMLERNGVWTKFDWSQKYYKDTAKASKTSHVQWCAFYSDCPHKVEAVTEGYRLTLTYNLEWIPEDDEVGETTCTMPNLHVKLKEALASNTFLPNGGRIGFSLEHRYPIEEGNGQFPSVLKGKDEAIKQVLNSLGLKYQFKAVVRSEDQHEEDRDQDYDDEAGNKGWALVDWHEFLDLFSIYEEEYGSLSDLLLDCCKGTIWATDLYWIEPPKYIYDRRFGAYGNEVRTDVLYAAACLIVDVPPAKDRAIKKSRTEKDAGPLMRTII